MEDIFVQQANTATAYKLTKLLLSLLFFFLIALGSMDPNG